MSFFILQQGLSLSKVAMLELLDAGIDKKTQATIEKIVTDLVDGDELLAVRNVRGVKCGGEYFLLPFIKARRLSARDRSYKPRLDYRRASQHDR